VTEADRTWAELSAGPLFEAAPDAMVLVDQAGTIVLVNAQVERLFGWQRAELIGQPIEALLPTRFRATHSAHRAGYERAAHLRPMGVGLELSALRKDGSEFPVEIALSPITTSRGQLVSAAVRDVSDRRRMDRAARVAHERLLSALESFQDGLAIFDADDRLVLCNSAYRHALPTTWTGPVVGATYEALLDAEIETLDLGSEPAPQHRAKRLAERDATSSSIEVRTRDGRSLRVVGRRTPEGGHIRTLYDLSDDARRQAELEEARRAAETANAAKTEFLRSMSHELRTPLNAILGFAQLLQRDPTLAERPQRLVGQVLKGGEHLLRLIDDVLDLARVESGVVPLSLEPVSVREVLDEVRATLAPMAQRRGVTLSVEVADGDALVVRADRTRLSQIVLNYGSNAIKYGRKEGRAILRASRDGNFGRVSVADDGPGIASDRQDRIFQAFYRAGQETGPIEGTGIGLALSRRLATMMEGTVGFESRQGAGSVFWVELPIDLPLTPTLTANAPDVPAAASHTTSRSIVLYVEDNPANLMFMEELVRDLPRVELITAPTGELGLELAVAVKPAVVILDINLPGISGFEVLRAMRAREDTRSIPVLALSASAMERDVRRAEEAGFARYLTKPVKVDQLIEALERHLP
jgi:PAS domain S-box-containing protein